MEGCTGVRKGSGTALRLGSDLLLSGVMIVRREMKKKQLIEIVKEHRHRRGVRTESDALLMLPPRFAHVMESAYWGKDKGKWARDWEGGEMRGVQRGEHEELAKGITAS